MELGAIFALGGLLFKVLIDNIEQQQLAIDSNENTITKFDALPDSPLYILPRELLSNIATYLTSAQDIWPFYFTCRRFQQLITANESQYSIVESPLWIHHYLLNVAREIGLKEKPLLDYVTKTLNSLIFEGGDIVPMSRKFVDASFSQEYCHVRYLNRQTVIIPDSMNPFIPERAKTIQRPLINRNLGLGCIWVPDNPDSADMFKEFKLVGEIIPALINKFQGFAPHFIHRYVLPVLYGQHKLTTGEKEIFSKQGKYLIEGLSDYLRWLYKARTLECTNEINSSDIAPRLKAIEDFFESMGLPRGLLHLRLTISDLHEFNRAKPIILVGAHWNMDVEKIVRNFPRQALENPNEIEEILASGILREPATFENILDIFTN